MERFSYPVEEWMKLSSWALTNSTHVQYECTRCYTHVPPC